MSGSQTVGEYFGQWGIEVPEQAEDMTTDEYLQTQPDDGGPWVGDAPETWPAGITIPDLNPDDIQEDAEQIRSLDYPVTPEEIADVSPEIDASTVRSRLGDEITRQEIESMNFDPIGFVGSSALEAGTDFTSDVADTLLGAIWESTAGKLVIVLLVVYVVGQLVDVEAGGAAG